jgi:broad-specificity NMP kinase
MSGTGKSTACAELARRGFSVVETDHAPWSDWSERAGGYVWNEELVSGLLDREPGTTLYLSGTVSNQGRFYPRFDAIVLLSAPVDVLLRRIESRKANDYGKSVSERERILSDISNVEPLLRATCTHELDATQSVASVVAELIAIGENVASRRPPATR